MSTEKKIYGLIGYPLNTSLSALMHNTAFSYLKINAKYKLFALKEKELEGFLNNLKKNNIFGLNVTIPYKEKVIPFLDKVSCEARLIGAVNTIKRQGNKLLGFNTDGGGFLKDLTCDLKFNPKKKAIAILGAGGASRAVSIYLSKTKPKRISIYDVDKAKSRALINHLKDNFKDVEFICANSIGDLDIKNIDLLVNATPQGMNEGDVLPIAENLLHKNLFVYDLIYNPRETRLLRLAKEKGAKVANGLGMLLYQGMAAFKIWTGKKAPVQVMRKALKEAIYK